MSPSHDRSSASTPDPTWEEAMEMLDRLPGLPLAERAEVIERLVLNSSPGIRERALRIGAAVLSDDKLIEYLRCDEDAVLRNAALEILKERGAKSFKLAVELVRDANADVALQAVLLLNHLKDPRAVEPLRAALVHPDPNVIQEAIVALGHLGDHRTIADLLPFLDSDPWVRVAAIQALGDLRSPEAVEPLAGLLTDLETGTLAAEALAQIGGPEAFAKLSEHWLRFQEELDPETTLGLLAHALEGLPEPPAEAASFRASLARRLRDPFREVRRCAARCLVALGPGPEDGEALAILAGGDAEAGLLPGCLALRADLVDRLLDQPGVLQAWGFLLAARHPESASIGRLAAALRAVEASALEPVLEALARNRDPRLGAPLVDLFLSLPRDARALLAAAFRTHREAVSQAVAERDDLRPEDRLVLASLVDEAPESIAAGILELPPEGQSEVVSQLAARREVVARLPWEEWLEADPRRYTDLASQVAIRSELVELRPLLRRRLRDAPSPALIRAVGELGDREAVETLVGLLGGERSVIQPLAVESLGLVGGPEVRGKLRELAGSSDPGLARVAYRALAKCAVEEDEAFFRAAAAHRDWFVRLACAEVLGRFGRSENLETLSRLAADPVAAVARRAQTALGG